MGRFCVLIGVYYLVRSQGGRGMRLPFVSPKFRHQTVSTVQAFLYYTVTRYIPFGVYFLIVSIQIESHCSRCFSQLFEIFHSDQIVAHFCYASYWWRIDKEEGIRWRSYHLDQLQSWKSSQVRLVKIYVGVIMLTERFCPVLMLRPFKKHSANTTTQKIK